MTHIIHISEYKSKTDAVKDTLCLRHNIKGEAQLASNRQYGICWTTNSSTRVTNPEGFWAAGPGMYIPRGIPIFLQRRPAVLLRPIQLIIDEMLVVPGSRENNEKEKKKYNISFRCNMDESNSFYTENLDISTLFSLLESLFA